MALPECAKAESVRRGEQRTCEVANKLAVTWWPPEVPEQLVLVK